ncbi:MULTISPECIES: galactonate dehydratase [unclassified Microbacterium]|uniref:galactonate dehydratase n=1 Tax=unclassified Microbacterium TaxID=2609290 RepID=UPI001E4C0515|nr:galactonate dehydratase [Microbacterium sp. Au-Mic1]MCE4027172.1 galactonate dehydratase [Microbacterium sp. Au-Mic1]
MRIERVETFQVAPRWLFVAITTDDGLTGWGEPIVEGRAATVATAVAELSEYLVGSDPTRIEDTWQVLTKGGFYRGGPVFASAVAGIDQALWDIAGKRLGVPTYELLGGAVRDRVRIYGWIGGDRPSDLAADAERQVEAGLTAVKMNGSEELSAIDVPESLSRLVDRVAEVRAVLGDSRDIAIDFHGRYSPAMARRALPLLEPYLPLFVEEPVVPELSSLIGQIAHETPIPIATGERLYSRWDFRDVLADGIAVAQPDLSHAGGISEVRRIAAAAETYGVSLAPHCPLGPIALAACIQVDVATPNFLIQEQSLGIHYNVQTDLLDYLLDRSVFSTADGYIERPLGPGLGIEIDEKEVRRAAQSPHNWHNAVWRHLDGSFAEW